MTRHQVLAQFADVKRSYFRRWDRGNRWKVEFAGHDLCRNSTGYCDSKAATVFLDKVVCEMTEPGVRAFLIHEICHDVGGAGHSFRWARRMARAAQRATDRGESDVARLLRNDVYSYCGLDVYEQATGTTAPPSI